MSDSLFDIPENTDGMDGDEVLSLAHSYLDLIRMMSEAVRDCDTEWGFFRWNGRGFVITGHPPEELLLDHSHSDQAEPYASDQPVDGGYR